MKIETPARVLETTPTEFNTDPLLGEAGYRVQTDVLAGQTTQTCPLPQSWNGFKCA